MNGMNFAKGMGIGLIVGSAIGMAAANPQNKKAMKKSTLGRALRNIGEVIENVGETMGF